MVHNIAQQYHKEIYGNDYKKLKKSTDCNECREYCKSNNLKQSHPVPLNYIGCEFKNDKHKILFVGLEAYYTNKYKKDCTIRNGQTPDPTRYYFNDYEMDKLFFEENSGFWRWVREISREVIKKDDESFNYVAWTNLHKCKVHPETIAESGYKFNPKISENCIQNCKWIYNEINILQPKNVVIFGTGNNGRLPKLFFQSSISNFEKKNNIYFIKKIDRKKNIKFIQTYHPSYHLSTKNRKLLLKEIIKSIQNSKGVNFSEWDLPI